MRVLILGENKNEKGEQLEKLTKKILTHLKYKNISVNHIGNGGEEIDVKAHIPIPIPSGESLMPVIAECKAHNRAVDISDWLKFLGKLLTEETNNNGSSVFGCFIALSGVNGNVRGHFEFLRKRKNHIEIYDGEKLFEILISIFKLILPDEVSQTLSKISSRKSTDIDLIYYKDTVYWLITFSDNSYTILLDNGNPTTNQDVENLLQMIESSTTAHTYINLPEEEVAKNRLLKLQKDIITLLMQSDNKNESDIAETLNDYSKTEIKESLNLLIEKNWIRIGKTNKKLSLPSTNGKDFYKIFIEILRFIFTGEFNQDLLETNFYNSHINSHLLNEILKIQENLNLSDEEKKRALNLLQISPSAVAFCLYPNPMFMHRREAKEIDLRMDTFDKNHFFRNLYNFVRADFENAPLFSFLFEKKGIRELEIKSEIKIKLEDDSIEEILHTRLGIGRAADELGGKHVSMLLVEDVPEKWWKLKAEDLENKN